MIALKNVPRLAGLAPRTRSGVNARGACVRMYSQDILIKWKTGMPQVSRGPVGLGRNSYTGSIATVFGATGFLGRYLVSKLAKIGTQVVVPYRDEDEKRHLRVLGDLGQIVPLEWDLRNERQIMDCLSNSDTVFNLTGRDYATNADPNSESEFLRTKALGEDAVRNAFSGATVVRPASIYGHEDRFLNKLASWPITWKLNHMQTKRRPVHALDVAQALRIIAQSDNASMGQTYSLAGPKTYTVRELMELTEGVTYQKLISPDINVPRFLFSIVAGLGERVAWWPMFNKDEVRRRFIDDAPDAPGTKTFADLDITPDVLEDVAIAYLRRYRSFLRYEQPLNNATPGVVKLKKTPFRVIE
ncbi:Protein-lysine N-methyltransferase efm5 [Malassezia sp. CBS 17886]|nr:Protein-lysine N-methyltransferase efm5 [Malassezia sp. CBS 17886]